MWARGATLSHRHSGLTPTVFAPDKCPDNGLQPSTLAAPLRRTREGIGDEGNSLPPSWRIDKGLMGAKFIPRSQRLSFILYWQILRRESLLTAVISHTRPPTIFFPFQKLRFGGRQSNVSMTITASEVTGTDISMSIIRVFELLFHLYLNRRWKETEK